MTTSRIDFDIYQGEAKVFNVQVFEDDEQQIPKDLSGASLLYRIGLSIDESTLATVVPVPIDAQQGQVDIDVPGSATANLPPRAYDHELIATDGLGHMNVVMAGRLLVRYTLP